MSANEVVGVNVRELRKASKMSQAALAAALAERGIQAHQTTVAKLERGNRPTTVDDLAAVADVFGVLPADLLAGGGLTQLSPDDLRMKVSLLTSENARLKGLLQGIAKTAEAGAS